MSTGDRFDICAAHHALEADWNRGGWLPERPSNQRRLESTGMQLHRIGYEPAPGGGGFDTLSENAKEIYVTALVSYGLAVLVRKDDDLGRWIASSRTPEFLAEHFPQLLPEPDITAGLYDPDDPLHAALQSISHEARDSVVISVTVDWAIKAGVCVTKLHYGLGSFEFGLAHLREDGPQASVHALGLTRKLPSDYFED